MSNQIRILIADDHKIMRDGLRTLLEEHSNLLVIAEAGDGREAVKLAAANQADIVVMDISMPLLNGIEATRQIVESSPNTRVIALSMHSDRHYVAGIFKAGASGYLLKDCAGEELVDAIKTVHAKQTYLSRAITTVMVKEFVSSMSDKDFDESEELTDREKEVLQLIAEGKSTKQIADLLSLSIKTIETHRQNIMKKLELYSVPELTKYAIKTGLTSLDN